ncbi:MAG: hypothetical protein M1823_002476 [Watsoniomyces obsoletus]|nr:MAG: hypothetical protein M1823_002476 [Watsoniomyces obsoletus]
MMEAFAASGTAAGILSLGITVCGGLIEYYSSWKDHGEDISTTYKNIKDLEDVLKDLQSVLERGKFRPELSDGVDRRITACSFGLQKLQKKWNKVKKTDESGSTSTSLRSRISDQARKMSYPFREKTLLKLQRTCDGLRTNLMLALAVLGTDTVAENRAALKRIETGSGELMSVVLSNSADVTATAENVGRMSGDLAGMGRIIGDVKQSMLTGDRLEQIIILGKEDLRSELQKMLGRTGWQTEAVGEVKGIVSSRIKGQSVHPPFTKDEQFCLYFIAFDVVLVSQRAVHGRKQRRG